MSPVYVQAVVETVTLCVYGVFFLVTLLHLLGVTNAVSHTTSVVHLMNMFLEDGPKHPEHIEYGIGYLDLHRHTHTHTHTSIFLKRQFFSI